MVFHKPKLYFVTVLFLIAANLLAQNDTLRIKFCGNAGLSISDGSATICFDFPYGSGAFGYMRFDSATLKSVPKEAVLIFTHRHPDHYHKSFLKGLTGKKFARRSRKKISKQLPVLVPGVTITSFRTRHRFAFVHYSYLLDWHGKRFYISGDTEHPETIASIKAIDYAFIPPWIEYYLKEKGLSIDTKTKVFYHLYPNEKIKDTISGDYKVFDKLGMEVSVPY